MHEPERDPRATLPNRSASSLDSQASDQAVRTTPIERLFSHLAAIYGLRFTRLWAGVDPEEVKATWTEYLQRFPADQVMRAVDSCAFGVSNPPTLPEFIELVRSCYIAPPRQTEPKRLLPSSAYGFDPLNGKVELEYPREASPPWRYWARRIIRWESLGRRMPHVSLMMAKAVLSPTEITEIEGRL